MKRRDLLKGVIASTAAAGLASAQEIELNGPVGGPFSLPTTTFQKGQQHHLPAKAFTEPLQIPPVALPTRVGRFEDLHGKPVFGNQDPLPLGDSFHGIAKEWAETPMHWQAYGCVRSTDPMANWQDKREHFGKIEHYLGEPPVENWSGFKPKCYKIPIVETYAKLHPDAEHPARLYSYAGMVPGPTIKMRLGEPVVVRFENHLEAETSVHLHGGHSPSHSDGFPVFYVLQGKSRDYFYPNILPLFQDADGEYVPDVGESQSTMWYHDHAMDATAYNVSKGLAGFALCYSEPELKLIHDRVLPGYGPHSCIDPSGMRYTASEDVSESDLTALEDPEKPGFYHPSKEPYRNPFDIPLVLQDKVIDQRTGQIAYDLTSHDGYLGDTFLVNGVAWPKLKVRNRKYRFRILDGSNARVFRLRLMTADDFEQANKNGIGAVGRNLTNDAQPTANDSVPTDAGSDDAGSDDADSGDFGIDYDRCSLPYLRIGKDSWLWSKAVQKKSIVLAMANRADIVIDFDAIAGGLQPGESKEFILVNTMPQFDGRGPKPKLEDGGDPRVLPVPFDVQGDGQQIPKTPLVELNRPIGLMKFVVCHAPPGTAPDDPAGDCDASIEHGTPLVQHREIPDSEVSAVREFIFERGKGAWKINGRFYDPFIANASPRIDSTEEWILRNGGGGWWHPIHIHLESHQLISYEKDFEADEVVDRADPPGPNLVLGGTGEIPDIIGQMDPVEAHGLHDTQVLGPNTVARIRIRTRTWNGPFVFHCHNLEHEDMRMMFNFETVAAPDHDPNIAPDARTHGNDLTFQGSREQQHQYVGELEWEYSPIPKTPVEDAGQDQIPPRDPTE
ncbi:multicopper oxidase family protein [Stieleria varia]|uniref:Spore coat protein A n=1 Tax=Stieleria varia TaxID=2528005 RepID=A0A5C6B346_9BACT|nr:multicopper oxidase domain-containing protein [Stieleria varia]TWU05686.1 Spore coat protein A [Stieleria varia]